MRTQHQGIAVDLNFQRIEDIILGFDTQGFCFALGDGQLTDALQTDGIETADRKITGDNFPGTGHDPVAADMDIHAAGREHQGNGQKNDHWDSFFHYRLLQSNLTGTLYTEEIEFGCRPRIFETQPGKRQAARGSRW
jgi:hypothetical protein